MLPPGRMFGEIAFFSPDRLRTAKARCTSACTVLSIDETSFKQLFFENPDLGFEIDRLIAGRLTEDVHRMEGELESRRDWRRSCMLWKVYSPKKYVFISQVEGGITPSGICAITARVMLMPLTPTAKAGLFRPRQVATAFDAVPSSTAAQCKATAAEKLKKATTAAVSSLIKS